MKIFIPIKKNSQRVFDKNFRDFDGVPLYRNTLDKLRDFEVYVDTDSTSLQEEIGQEESLSSVHVYQRSEHLRGDEVSVCLLIEDFISRFNIDSVVAQIHVTSPFLRAETIRDAMGKIDLGHDSVVSCNRINSRLWRKESYGFCPMNHNPVKLEQTQDLPPLYEENSAFYLFHSETFKKTGNRVGKNPFFYEISFPENLDIDSEADWDMCHNLKKHYIKKED